MSLLPYAEYKDSGVAWLGEIPAHWEVWKLSHAFYLIGSGTTPKSDNLAFYENGHIPWLNTGDLNDGILTDCEKRVTELAITEHPTLKLYPAGSIAIAMYGATIGKLSILDFSTTANQACCIFAKSEYISKKFLFYWLQAFRQKIISLATGGGQPNISQEILRSLKVSCPKLEEQAEIESFLDHETAKIDALIAEQEKLIALLAEKRQAVISHAVTKGLNPDAPMKDSGIVWLGEVPAHWEVLTFQRCVNIAEGQVNPEDEPYRSMMLIAPNHIESATGKLIYTETAEEQSAESGKYICNKGDVIYSKIRPALRKVCIAPENCLCSADMYPLCGSNKISNHFLMWFMLSEAFSALAELESQRVAMPKINRESLKEVWIAIPPREEQANIISTLNTATQQLDALKNTTEQAIELLKERRSALISAAVTGKIDVRNWQPEASAA